MKIRIHRGTREIGGTCVEIEAEGRRVVLDVGVPLDVEPEDVPLHRYGGSTPQTIHCSAQVWSASMAARQSVMWRSHGYDVKRTPEHTEVSP